MRIVMLTDDIPIDRRIMQEAATLQGQGHQVFLLAGHKEGLPKFEIVDGVRIERAEPLTMGGREQLFIRQIWRLQRIINGLHRRMKPLRPLFERAGTANNYLAGAGLRLVRLTRRVPIYDRMFALRAAYYRPDVVHSHDLPRLRAGVLAAERLGVPMVYDAHELYPAIGTLTPKQQRQLTRIEQEYIPRCSATITVNPYIADEMARRYSVPAPRVILNAIDEAAAPATHGGFHEELGLGADARIVLFQGWLSPTRGLDHLVRSMAFTSPNVHLVFMSYGDMATDLRRLAEVVGVRKRVHFKDAVPQSELLGWTASADVGVIPYPAVDLNHRLCSPNKLFEFIQARLPIVANDLPFLRDVVVGEHLGVVAAIENHRAFGEALDQVANASAEQRAEFRTALDAASPRYSWASQEKVLLDIYATLPITHA